MKILRSHQLEVALLSVLDHYSRAFILGQEKYMISNHKNLRNSLKETHSSDCAIGRTLMQREKSHASKQHHFSKEGAHTNTQVWMCMHTHAHVHHLPPHGALSEPALWWAGQPSLGWLGGTSLAKWSPPVFDYHPPGWLDCNL